MGSPVPTAQSDAESLGRVEDPVLVIESEPRAADHLVDQLRADGYLAIRALSVGHARSLARACRPRAAVLGELDGPHGTLDLLCEIRKADPDGLWDPDLPIIVLSRRPGGLAVLRAFEEGADDFLARGAGYLELRARLGAVLRRVEHPRAVRLLHVGPISIDTSAHIARVASNPVDLCRLEYELLAHLARRPTHVFTKDELLREIWGYSAQVGARTVDSHLSRLRRKLQAAGAPGMVVNVWGVGYRLI